MEFCPHCGIHLRGHKQFCINCGPQISWWFENKKIVSKLGLEDEETWRNENGEVHTRGWERKEDGRYHPFSWVRNKVDDRYYPPNWESLIQ